MGKDARFDEIRTNPKRFLRFFIIQAVSSWIISLPFLFRLMKHNENFEPASAMSLLEWGGIAIAVIGLIMEGVADQQKNAFKFQKGNGDKLFTGGLYGFVQYPNYLGEILFWIGIFIASIPALSGWSWLTITSPLIIIALLLFLSGIPTIEKARKKKHKDNPVYHEYVKRTSKLIPGIY